MNECVLKVSSRIFEKTTFERPTIDGASYALFLLSLLLNEKCLKWAILMWIQQLSSKYCCQGIICRHGKMTKVLKSPQQNDQIIKVLVYEVKIEDFECFNSLFIAVAYKFTGRKT